MSTSRSVLFVCVSNRGKSVMAQGLSSTLGAGAINASSAGTDAAIGKHVNDLSAQVLAEVGVDIDGHTPRQLTDDLMRDADLTVVLGTSAQVTPPDGAVVEVWETDEPSVRGIDGIERMRLIRDDIAARITDLTARLADHA
ncbi:MULTISPECIES: low molecular weight phosphatase family protein [Gordonia]|uniref:arsenate-mycothiol transferase ArsC n=1 Tax=Gordonia TaxID=2053 RepID=UPI0002A62B63|nr:MULTISPECIES: low molecular weight phosphatase family protein [Gordonia]ATD71713.1 low molecular weight phosphatase family protein [Gordonia sp. 1D]MDJ0453607.1 low molecular weight phosphatase family protein [Gordonia amicalis]MDV7077483.1 low molecular weight phosphatase family protein [Gordonia amicalis]MDV7174427.1 low molecular weight phosphatase family protein [Gordonia amicalis]NKX78005.1 low molecular weight phosphatase family protein [Gordonia amicalis]